MDSDVNYQQLNDSNNNTINHSSRSHNIPITPTKSALRDAVHLLQTPTHNIPPHLINNASINDTTITSVTNGDNTIEPPLPTAKQELKTIFDLSWPVAFSILCRIGMSVTDLAMVGHLDSDYLSASATALVWINITSAFLYRGYGQALNTLCSQALGANNHKLVGLWLQTGLFCSTISCIPVGIAWYFTENVLLLIGIDSNIAKLSGTFAQYSLIWLFPLIWFIMIQRYFQSQSIVRPALMVNALFVLINLGLNYLLIYGAGSWNGLGYIGSPIATGISRWLLLFTYIYYTIYIKQYHKSTWLIGWTKESINKARLKIYLVSQAIPLMIGVCLEEWQLEVIAIFAARLGSIQIATHNAALEIFFFLTSFMFGLMTAVSVRTGYYLGSNRPLAAKRVGIVSFYVAIGLGAIIGGLFAALKDYVGRIYSNDPDIWNETSHIAILVGGCYFALALFYTAMAVLDGQGRPGIVALSFAIGAWCVSVPLSYVFAFTIDEKLIGLWYGLITGYAVVTFIVVYAWLKSDWNKFAQLAIERAEKKFIIQNQDNGYDVSYSNNNHSNHNHNHNNNTSINNTTNIDINNTSNNGNHSSDDLSRANSIDNMLDKILDDKLLIGSAMSNASNVTNTTNATGFTNNTHNNNANNVLLSMDNYDNNNYLHSGGGSLAVDYGMLANSLPAAFLPNAGSPLTPNINMNSNHNDQDYNSLSNNSNAPIVIIN